MSALIVALMLSAAPAVAAPAPSHTRQFTVAEEFDLTGFLSACHAAGVRLHYDKKSDGVHGFVLLADTTLTVTLYGTEVPARVGKAKRIVAPAQRVHPKTADAWGVVQQALADSARP